MARTKQGGRRRGWWRRALAAGNVVSGLPRKDGWKHMCKSILDRMDARNVVVGFHGRAI
jgi:hypothetical protein